MLSTFTKYFFTYIVRSRTRQHLLFLAIIGLIISAFALLVMQSTMGGLQRNLITRSKLINGSAVLIPSNPSDLDKIKRLKKDLLNQNINAVAEYELEVLAKNGTTIIPVVVHGIDPESNRPKFLKDLDFEEMVIPFEVSYKLGLSKSDDITIISPAHVNHFMGDIPRMINISIDSLITTDVPEVDLFHIWVSLKKVQSLIRAREVNRIRLYGDYDADKMLSLVENNYKNDFRIVTWEQQNDSLVWALSLENRMIIFLFIGMTLLVSLCIISGLFIFFSKIKTDLSAFWILGSSKAELQYASKWLLNLMGIISVCIGIVLALGFLFALEKWDLNVMPDVFVDRKIPVYITLKGIFLSFFIPTSISIAFSHLALNSFKKETDYLEHIRSVGN